MDNNKYSLQEYQEKYLGYLLSGNHRECSNLIHSFISQESSIVFLYEKVIKKSLYDLGLLWEQNKISIATEHMGSSIVESNLNELYPVIVSSDKRDKTAIVSCLENEMHQIGVKMVADILEMHGWNVHFLGANTPTSDLLSFTKSIKPQLLALSLSIYFHLPTLENVLRLISEEFPDLNVLVGGQAFQHGGREVLNKFPNVHFGSNLMDVREFVTTKT
jgi:MerR family transcriptional regulator, light-induced transcriptional regulator